MACLPCLVLDHDDTVVASTPTIHYPAFLDAMKLLRPEVNWSLHEYVLYNFEPGFEAICREMLHLTDEEMLVEQKVWKQWTSTHVPPMFPGMAELLRRYRDAGGILCVASHSSEEMIRRDYRVHCGFEPREIPASARETLLVAMERAGIRAPAKCRAGGCGFCHSRLISGKFSIAGADKRRLADEKFGYIHPCCTYPDSDMEIEVPRG